MAVGAFFNGPLLQEENGHSHGGEVRILLDDRSRREARKQNRRYCCPSLVVLITILLVLAVVLGVSLGTASILNRLPNDPHERALALLKQYPLIDGHNDLAEQLRSTFMNQLDEIHLTKNTSGKYPEWHTDIPRLRAGHVGAQFWSAYISCDSQYKDATRAFMDQVDAIKRVVSNYSSVFKFATSVADIKAAYGSRQIASLIGIEGGHAIDSSLATLRQFYTLGGRYMTLTHTCNTPWAHNSYDTGDVGLTKFGKALIHEMNRIGMMVDISHVNNYTMLDVLETTLAPVIFSHSSSYALCPHPRNVPDDVLQRLSANNGIVMVTFVPEFVNCENASEASLEDVADHIDHMKEVAGVDHVGIGSDFDGTELVPTGLEDVSKYPDLFAELIKRGYSDSDIIKIARTNLLRVLEQVETVRDKMRSQGPNNKLIDPQPDEACRPDF